MQPPLRRLPSPPATASCNQHTPLNASSARTLNRRLQDWAKPLGFGANRASKAAATNNATWSAAAFAAGDPLAAWMMDPVGGAGDDFFFSHHTFSHQNLDNATTYDTDIQIELNIQMAVSGLYLKHARSLLSPDKQLQGRSCQALATYGCPASQLMT